MKKFSLLMIAIIMTTMFIGCVNKNLGVVQPVNVNTESNGNPVAGRIFLCDKPEYKFIFTEGSKQDLEITLDFYNPDLIINYSDFVSSYNFFIMPRDIDGKEVLDADSGSILFNSVNIPEGNNFSIKFKYNFPSEEAAKVFLTRLCGFTIYKNFDMPTEGSTESTSSESSSNTDWDKIIDEYEDYVTKTIACAKKMKTGDTGAVSEYAQLCEDAAALQSKLQNAESQLSPEQAKRLTKIINKLATDASGI